MKYLIVVFVYLAIGIVYVIIDFLKWRLSPSKSEIMRMIFLWPKTLYITLKNIVWEKILDKFGK